MNRYDPNVESSAGAIVDDVMLSDLGGLQEWLESLEGRSSGDLPSSSLEGDRLSETLVRVEDLDGEMRVG